MYLEPWTPPLAESPGRRTNHTVPVPDNALIMSDLLYDDIPACHALYHALIRPNLSSDAAPSILSRLFFPPANRLYDPMDDPSIPPPLPFSRITHIETIAFSHASNVPLEPGDIKLPSESIVTSIILRLTISTHQHPDTFIDIPADLAFLNDAADSPTEILPVLTSQFNTPAPLIADIITNAFFVPEDEPDSSDPDTQRVFYMDKATHRANIILHEPVTATIEALSRVIQRNIHLLPENSRDTLTIRISGNDVSYFTTIEFQPSPTIHPNS